MAKQYELASVRCIALCLEEASQHNKIPQQGLSIANYYVSTLHQGSFAMVPNLVRLIVQ